MIIITSVIVSLIFTYRYNTSIDNNINTDSKEVSITKSTNKEHLIVLEKVLKEPNLILVNKKNFLPEDFEANDIMESQLPFLNYIETTKLNKVAASKLKEMFKDAKEDGILLLGASGYRTYNMQVNLFNSSVKKNGKDHALKYSAPPGASEHETGYALDIVSEDFKNLSSDFENTNAFKWLEKNAFKYGFILRYPKDKTEITGYAYEPWHYRYVGEEHAKYIYENKISLEEYLDYINKEITYLNSELKKGAN